MENIKINQIEDFKKQIDEIIKLVEKYPNDQDLGSRIRNYYWENLKK